MNNIPSSLHRFITDTRGAVITVELGLLSTLAFIGLVVAFAAARDSVVSELSDVAGSVQSSNQSYSYNEVGGQSSKVNGSEFLDSTDAADDADDAPGQADNCITFDVVPSGEANAKPAVSDDDQVLLYEFASTGNPADTSPFGNSNNGILRNGASVVGGELVLDGVNDYVLIPNSNDINTTIVDDRTIAIDFTPTDVTSRQVVYEEGGGLRGINVYIDGGSLYVGAYNFRESVFSAFLSTPISAGVPISVSLRLDATSGTLAGFIDGVQFGSTSAGRIYSHGGANGLGGLAGNTVIHTGVLNASGANPYTMAGTISNFQIYNRALSDDEICSLSD